MITYELLAEDHPAVAVVRKVRDDLHPGLVPARIAVAFVRGKRPDPDGHLWLGSMKRVGLLDRELHGNDWILRLNGDAWDAADARRREALVHHELCHAAPVVDDNGTQATEAGRLKWRVRRHDVEEFVSVVERYGITHAGLEAFAKAAVSRLDAPLFGARDMSGAAGSGE